MESVSARIYNKIAENIVFIITIVILFCIMFGGNILSESVKNGAGNVEKRLGADIMIVSGRSSDADENVLLAGSREYNYFDKEVYDKVRKIDGVKDVSYQFHLASFPMDCCTNSNVSIIGFDVETDFLIQSWIEIEYSEKIENGEAVIGGNIAREKDGSVKLFGKKYQVAKQLAETGTPMDTSIYFSLKYIPQIVEDAKEKQYGFMSDENEDELVSTIFLNVDKNVKLESLTKAIRTSTKEDIKIVYTKGITKVFLNSLSGFVKSINFIIAMGSVMSIIIIYIVNLMESNNRKRQYAVQRIVGATISNSIFMVIKEKLFIILISDITGAVLTSAVVFPFGKYIGKILKMSYLAPDIGTIIFILLRAILISVCICIIAAAYPVIKVCRIEPYIALREEE